MNLKTHQKEKYSLELKRTIILEAILIFAFAQSITRVHQSIWVLLFGLLLFISLTAPIILFANPELVKAMRKQKRFAQNLFLALICILYFLTCGYGFASGQFNATPMAISFIWIGLCIVLLFQLPPRSPSLISDLVFVFILWLPSEFYLAGALGLPAAHPVMQPFFFLAVIIVIYYIFVNRAIDPGYTFKLKGDDYRHVVLNFLLYFFIAIIISLLGGFLSVSERLPSFSYLLWQLVRILFLVAIPEELLFRGAIYRLLVMKFKGRSYAVGRALLGSSLIFALSRANDTIGPLTDIDLAILGVWHAPLAHMLLAAVAGIFYGLVFIRTKKIVAAALVHLGVEWMWLVFFHG